VAGSFDFFDAENQEGLSKSQLIHAASSIRVVFASTTFLLWRITLRPHDIGAAAHDFIHFELA
jgi:hypothetical protein